MFIIWHTLAIVSISILSFGIGYQFAKGDIKKEIVNGLDTVFNKK